MWAYLQNTEYISNEDKCRAESVITGHCLVKILTNWVTTPHTITSESTVQLEKSQKSQTKP